MREDLVKDTTSIFKSPLAEWQKLDAFWSFLFPRLTCIFQVIFPGSTWCKRLDATLRGIIKQVLRLPRRTCSQYLYLPLAFQVMKDVVGACHLNAIKRSSNQGRAFDSLSLHPDSTFFTYTGAFLL